MTTPRELSADNTYRNRDWLYEQYVVQWKTAKDIASECGVKTEAVKWMLKKFAIRRAYRQPSDPPMIPDNTSVEEWRVIPTLPLYEASNLGRVRAFKTGKVRKTYLRDKGGGVLYYMLTLWDAEVRKYKSREVHTLVLEAFVGKRPAGMYTCHNDGDSTNNRLSNLRYDTPKSNYEDMRRHGTLNIVRGERRGHAKLTETEVLEIRRTYRPFDKGYSLRALARRFNISRSVIRSILSNNTWDHVREDKAA